MANTIEEAFKIVKDEKFKVKIEIIMKMVAGEIIEEANTIPFHNQRASWAIRALSRGTEEARKATFVLSSKPGITVLSDDGSLVTAVRQIVNILAGAFVPEVEAAEGVTTQTIVEETDHDANPVTPPVVTKRTITNRFRNLLKF